MKLAFTNPTTTLTVAPESKDIIFDLTHKAVYARGVKFDGTSYSVFKKHTSNNLGGYVGLVPVPSYTNTTTRFLREDGTWVIPTNTTYEVFTGSTLANSGKSGLVPAPSVGFPKLLLSDGTWTLKFLKYVIPESSAIKITFYDLTHATLFMRHTYSNNMGVYHVSGYGNYGLSGKRISIVEVTNSCSGIIYPVEEEFAIIIKNPDTLNPLYVSMTLLCGSISKIETVTSEVSKSNIWRTILHSDNSSVSSTDSSITVKINGTSKTLTNTNYYPIRSYSSGLQISSYNGSTNCQLFVPYATASQAGVVTTGNLVFSGVKTFSDIYIKNTKSTRETDHEICGNSDGLYIRGEGIYIESSDGDNDNYDIILDGNFLDLDCDTIAVTGQFTTSIYAPSFYELSDERLKDFHDDLNVSFDDLKKIRKSYFTWKDDDGKQHIGTSAQLLQKIYPELVSEAKDGTLTVDYAKLSIIALAAIDKLDERLRKVESKTIWLR